MIVAEKLRVRVVCGRLLGSAYGSLERLPLPLGPATALVNKGKSVDFLQIKRKVRDHAAISCGRL